MKRCIRASAKRAAHLIGARWPCQLATVPPVGLTTLDWGTRPCRRREVDRLTLEPTRRERFFEALQAAGMREAQGEFSVALGLQIVSSAMLAEIAGFIRTFDHVTGREAWQAAARREAPTIAQPRRREVCFFSAWDFHLPLEGGFQLIEFNDNGSGFLFAAIVNALFYEATELARKKILCGWTAA